MKGTLFLKRVSKTLSLLLLIATLSLSATKLVEAGTWRQDAKGWWYQNDNNSYPRSSWQLIGGQWYYFNTTGYMTTGWVNLGGSWYYLQPSGAMATGWINLSGTWYYLNPSGAMATGWLNLSGAWYHLQPSGAMSANRWEGNYYLEASGAMATNKWIGQYYVGADGAWIAGYQVPVATPIPTPTTPKPTEIPSYHPDPLVTPPPIATDESPIEEVLVYDATLSHEVFLEINNLRIKYGKEPFEQAHGIALQLSMIQAGSNVLQYDGTDISLLRHGGASVGMAYYQPSRNRWASTIVKTWEDSWGHLRNIIDEPNGSICAVAIYQYNDNADNYYTSVIATFSPSHERDLLFKDNITVIKQGLSSRTLDESHWESLLNPSIVR